MSMRRQRNAMTKRSLIKKVSDALPKTAYIGNCANTIYTDTFSRRNHRTRALTQFTMVLNYDVNTQPVWIGMNIRLWRTNYDRG